MDEKRKYLILLVEDDLSIANSLKISLLYKGFELKLSHSVAQGRAAFLTQIPDAVLLDINLPDGNGLDLCREIRQKHPLLPILMLTANQEEELAVKALETGADDHIRKPFGVQELAARILRLLAKPKKNPLALKWGSVLMHPDQRLAWVKEQQLNLGKREYEILQILVKKEGDVATRNDILNALGGDSDVFDRTIDSHLSHLRKKLKEAGALDIQITPVYGVGYRLEVK